MPRVLDTSAFLAGRQFPGELLTVPEVLRELHRHGMTAPLEAFLETQVAVASPDREALARVRVASEATGDAPRLSSTDVTLVALALSTGSILVTDDYSIQNVCRALGIVHEAVFAPGIAEQWTWIYRCEGCGKTWPEWHEECPTCGAPLRTARLGGRKSRKGPAASDPDRRA